MNITVRFATAVLLCGFLAPLQGQTKEQVKQQAETQLKQMTPQQIDAKIKEYGMTRQEAEAKAKALGIDLSAYVQQASAPPPKEPPSVPPTEQPATAPGDQSQAVSAQEVPQKQNIPTSAPPAGPGGLQFFGYGIFSGAPAAFEPAAAGPVDPEYVIGPSDVLRVTVWGQVEFQNELTIDKEGRVLIPTVGPVLVSGLTLEKAYDKLLKQMSRSYAGLVGRHPTVWMDLTLAKLRPKRVFMMGEVSRPGGYTISSYANVFNALYSIGGPTIRGSLRDVRVVRGDKVIAHVDLYNYFTGAEETKDIRVQNNDIIFVPPRGKTVSINKEVRNPAVFELLASENLKKLIEFAGGAVSTAYLERVQIDRIIPFSERQKGDLERRVLDVNFREILNQNGDFALVDGDRITIYSILDAKANFVMIDGAVARPGGYQLEKARTIRQLVLEADSLLPDAYTPRADIMRTRPDQTLEAIHVNLARALEGDSLENLLLEPLDQVRIYSVHEMTTSRFVSIRGHVKNAGQFPYADSLTLNDLIFKAGGLMDSVYRKRTYLDRADLIRSNEDGLTKTATSFNLGALLDGAPGVNRLLKPDDEVIVYGIEVAKTFDHYVEVRGKVRSPGRLTLTENMNLTDAILLAGGYLEDSYTLRAEVARVLPKGMGEDTLAYIRFTQLPDFSDSTVTGRLAWGASNAGGFRLKNRDVIFVRENPEFKLQRTVSVEGEVRFPGEYALIIRNESLSEVVKRAGGVTRVGYIDGGRMTRKGARVNVDFKKAVVDENEDHDIILQPGDVITIPSRPNSVTVQGEVNNPGILGYIDGDNLWGYLNRSGGLKDSAEYVLVTGPSGNTERVGTGLFHGNPRVADGSSITVTRVPPPPPEEKGESVVTVVKDAFAIMSAVATIAFIVYQTTK